ncbi:hypothetical protein FWK35_00035258 [Aphis craccivora]|uniref:Uncharacterized protein n=1 Tax=Aphis craccivora TaxID=307492 RepID=A0A6G0WUT4_APHCR|nr:hypothetical protein FWK35_00035258 [Aphis craccivora]
MSSTCRTKLSVNQIITEWHQYADEHSSLDILNNRYRQNSHLILMVLLRTKLTLLLLYVIPWSWCISVLYNTMAAKEM